MTGLLVLLVCIVVLILGVSVFNIHPIPILLFVGLLLGLATGGSVAGVTESLLTGFGNTLKWIGLIILFGTVLGEILAETGGAELIANRIIDLFGTNQLPLSMVVIGLIVGIPVFMDVAYLTLLPTIIVLSRKSGHSVMVLGLALAMSLTISHAMIPPTPGPLAVAAMLEMDISRIIPNNVLVAMAAAAGGLLWIKLNTKRLSTVGAAEKHVEQNESIEIVSYRKALPFVAILAPLFLMSLGTIYNGENEFVAFVKNPVWALIIGLMITFPLIPRKNFTEKLNQYFNKSAAKCAIVILITGAGGAFGQVIKDSQIVDSLLGQASGLSSGALMIPFFLSLLFTTVTGSITVSLITTSSIVAPLVSGGTLPPELTAAAICAGSLGIIHVNSSFFWLFKEMHGFTVPQLLKSFSLLTFVVAMSGGAMVLLLHLLG